VPSNALALPTERRLSPRGYVIASTDGSATPNPGAAGWAWFIDENTWAAGAAAHSTNNRAELAAMLNLFRDTAKARVELHIMCDSKYVIGAMTGNTAVKNADLIDKLRIAAAGRVYELEWVKGHNGHPMNEAADQLCTDASAAMKAGRDIATGPGWSAARTVSYA
jgi:ribonuclease HI